MGDIKWMGRLTAANSMYDLANYKGTSSLAACISSVSTNFCSELPLSCEMPQICCIFAAMSVSFSVFCIYLPPPWLLGISLSQHTIKFMVLSVLQGLTVLCSMTWVLVTMGTAHHGVTLAIMRHIIVTMGDIKWMGRLTAANSMYDLANYKGTSSLAACISSVSINFSGLTVLAHCAATIL